MKATVLRVVLAVLFGLAVVGFFFAAEHERAGKGGFLQSERMVVLLWLVPVVLLLRRGRADGEEGACISNVDKPLIALVCCAFFFLFTGAVKHPWFYFQQWLPQNFPAGAWFRSGLVQFVLGAALLSPFLTRRRPIGLPLFLCAVFLSGMGMCYQGLIVTSGGAALYRDDHPSFLFRLCEFAQTFPRLENYNPFWNGGVREMAGTTSGTTAIGLPFWLFWRTMPTHEIYTWVVGFAYIVVVPVLSVLSVRAMGARWAAAWCAGIMALGVSRFFFLWMLHYGTVGAVLSSSFILPLTACVYRLVWRGKTGWGTMTCIVLSSVMLLQWPPGAMMGAMLAFSLVVSCRQWTRRKILMLVAAGVLIAVITLREFWTILFHNADIMGYVMHEKAGSADVSSAHTVISFSKGFWLLIAHWIEWHPFLVFLGIGGVFFLPHGSVRRWFLPLFAGFAVLAGWGEQIKPNLQLARMAIPFAFVALAPAAIVLGRILHTGGRTTALVRAGVLSLLVVGVLSARITYQNASNTGYVVLDEKMKNFSSWITEHVPVGARFLYAGRAVHAYGGGHVAYLPVITGREMMACDYYHFPPETVEYNYPPSAFRKDPAKMAIFFQAYNVSHVVTYHQIWKDFFVQNPQWGQECAQFGDKTVYALAQGQPLSMFWKGDGDVRATFNCIEVRLKQPADEVVLKYNWEEGLHSPDGLEVFPFEVTEGLRLIGIRPKGALEFRVEFQGQ